MRVIWIPAPGYEESTLEALKEEGGEIPTRLGFDPLSGITVGLAVTMLVGALIRLYRDAKYMGVLIDATTRPLKVRQMPGWPRQQVLVITEEGAQFFSASQLSIAEELKKLSHLIREDD